MIARRRTRIRMVVPLFALRSARTNQSIFCAPTAIPVGPPPSSAGRSPDRHGLVAVEGELASRIGEIREGLAANRRACRSRRLMPLRPPVKTVAGAGSWRPRCFSSLVAGRCGARSRSGGKSSSEPSPDSAPKPCSGLVRSSRSTLMRCSAAPTIWGSRRWRETSRLA